MQLGQRHPAGTSIVRTITGLTPRTTTRKQTPTGTRTSSPPRQPPTLCDALQYLVNDRAIRLPPDLVPLFPEPLDPHAPRLNHSHSPTRSHQRNTIETNARGRRTCHPRTQTDAKSRVPNQSSSYPYSRRCSGDANRAANEVRTSTIARLNRTPRTTATEAISSTL